MLYVIPGTLGDTINGLSAPFLTISAIFLTYNAFMVQYRANKTQENCERKYGMARASAHHITIIVTNQYLQRKAFMLDKISLSE